MRINLRRETEDITSGKIKPPWQLLESIDDDVDRWQKLFEIHLEVNRELLNSTSVVDNLENEWKHLITKVLCFFVSNFNIETLKRILILRLFIKFVG